MLSQTGQYAIRAMVVLAGRDDGNPCDAAQIARLLGLPANYLAKILQTLARSGLLRSTRGIHGGYAIAKSLDEISLLAVVEPFENFARRDSCLMGRSSCGQNGSCAAHSRWRPVTDAYLAFLRENTLADLVGDPVGAMGPGPEIGSSSTGV